MDRRLDWIVSECRSRGPPGGFGAFDHPQSIVDFADGKQTAHPPFVPIQTAHTSIDDRLERGPQTFFQERFFQQSETDRLDTEPQAGVEAWHFPSRLIPRFREIKKRVQPEEPNVRRIAVAVRIREVWHDDFDCGVRGADPIKLAEQSEKIVDMLERVPGVNLTDAIFRELREGLIQVRENVGLRRQCAINIEEPLASALATAKIEPERLPQP